MKKQLWIEEIDQMKINNKEFGEWTADDLQVLLNDDAYFAWKR